MTLLKNTLLLFLATISLSGLVIGQSVTGTPPFASFQNGPYGTINLGNLNVHIVIPIVSKPGRGTPFNYSLIYDSTVWTPVTSGSVTSWQNSSGYGWIPQSPIYAGTIATKTVTGGKCPPYMYTVITSYTDPWNTTHRAALAEDPCDTGQLGWETLNDASGWTLYYQAGSVWVTSRSGQQFSVGSGSYVDTNGNEISAVGNTIVDTLGKTALTVSGTNPVVYTWTNPQGTTSSTKVYYTTFQIKTGFGCSAVNDVTIANVPLITSVVLPDNTSYLFDYEYTHNNSGYRTGRIASMTLPSGGQITYSYSGGDTGTGIECADGTTSGLKITTPDSAAEWNYSRSAGTSPAWQTTMTDPLGNDTIIGFSSIYETSRSIYQGPQSANILLKTLTTNYNCAPKTGCQTPVPPSIWEREVISQLPGGQKSKVVTQYDGFGNVMGKSESDYNNGNAFPPIHTTSISYYTTFTGPGLYDLPRTVSVTDWQNNIVAQTTYGYDETTPIASGITTQHVGVSCVYGAPLCRGNLTSVTYSTQGSSTLQRTFTYYDTGAIQSAVDVNGGTTTYAYGSGSCAGAFPTTLTLPVTTLSQTMTWNCDGGVMTQLTDANGNHENLTYNDPNFWRPTTTTDLSGNPAALAYGTSPLSAEGSLNFNGTVSTADVLTSLDSLGRTQFQQKQQAQGAPGSGTYDSVQYVYDGRGMQYQVSRPYAGSARQSKPANWPVTTWSYDALGRTTQVVDGASGTASWTFTDNDVLQSVTSPAKQRQYEYDGAGRLTSVCEITAGTATAPAGTCGQIHPQTGYWTKYTYDALNNLIGVAQNAQASSNNQSRTYTYDMLSRLTSETNPETNNVAYTYVYDTDGTCGTSNGDIVKRLDAVGNVTCFAYDKMHRLTATTYPSGSYHTSTPTKCYVYDAATVNSVSMTNAKGRLAEAYTGTGTSCPIASKTTDIGMSYSARGEVAGVYESTPHSSGYYSVGATYWPHGLLNQLTSNLSGLPTISYGGSGGASGLDGEGRILQVTASSGQSPVTGVTYTNSGTTQPIGSLTKVTLGSVDSDSFQYDVNTGRPTQYQFNVGTSQSVTGSLGWNTNGTLGSLNIADQLNSANSQSCTYVHDDLARLGTANCGSSIWSQTFSYDAFGNITKNVPTGSTGGSFQSVYNASTNWLSSVSNLSPTYDNNGNLTYDTFHNLTWDAEGKMLNVDSTAVQLTYDAFGRAVEQNRGGSYTEIVYAPSGAKLALMNGTTLVKAFVALPGGPTAVYASGTTGPVFYRHADWLGSSRLATTQSRTRYFDGSYAPFGENYNSSGTADYNFTGQNQDTMAGYAGYDDFLFREYSPGQGRWMSPDPAGKPAADPINPQSWNRYAYVRNNPLALVDLLGLDCVYLDAYGHVKEILDGDCKSSTDEGFYFDGTVDPSALWVSPTTGDVYNTMNGACSGDCLGMGMATMNVADTYGYIVTQPSSLNQQQITIPSPLSVGVGVNRGSAPQSQQPTPNPTLRQNFCFYSGPAFFGPMLTGTGLGMGAISWGGTLTTVGLGAVEGGSWVAGGSLAVGAATIGPYLAVGGAGLLVARGALC